MARRFKKIGGGHRGSGDHSDRGLEYVAEDNIAAPSSAGSERSLNRARHCSDYAALESVGSTLKSDTEVAQAIPVSRHHAELAVFDYIETF